MPDIEAVTDVPSLGEGPLIAAPKEKAQPKSREEFEALAPGTEFVDPEGVTRKKPYAPKTEADFAAVPEGAQFLDPEGALREKPRYEGIDFTAQTLYDMALTPKEKRKALERSYPGKVKEGPDGLYIEDEGKFRKPGRGITGVTGFMAGAALPTAGGVLGALGGSTVGPVGTAALGATGAMGGQMFNDFILQLSGIYDRSPSEELTNLGLAGATAAAGAGVGRGISTVVPSVKAGISAAGAAAPKALGYFLGAGKEDTAKALKLAEEGVLVPPSAWAPEAPHLQNMVEVFDPAFRTNKPLRESAVGFYDRESGRILDELGVEKAGEPPVRSVTPLQAGERIMQRTLADSAAADQRLQAALEKRAGELQAQMPEKTAQRESLQRAAEESRDAAQKLIDQGFKDIERDATDAMKVAEAGHYSGDLWEQVGGKFKAIRAGIGQRAKYWYDRYDAMTGGAKVSSEELAASAQHMLDELPAEFKSRNPVLVDKLAKLTKQVEEEGGAISTETTQLTYGQLHDLRSVFRGSADWQTLTSDFKNGALKRFSNEIDRLLHGGDQPEMITGAAVKFDGRVFTGPNHYAAVESAAKTLNRPVDDLLAIGEQENLSGFMTSDGRYISREDAFKIAQKTGQVDIDPELQRVGWNPDFLITEDMPRRYSTSPQVQRVKDIKAAGKFLDMVDKWYAHNIKVFESKQIKAVMKGLEAGEPADPQALYSAVVKEGHTDLIERIRKMVGPNLWSGVASADTQAMLDASKTLTPGMIDAKKFAREVLERHRANTLSVVHGKDAEKLLAQARAIEQLDGRELIPATPTDTLTQVIQRARNTAQAVKEAGNKDPLGLLNREMKMIQKDHQREVSRMARDRKNDPLGFLYDPTTGAIEATNKILGDEDLILAAAARFGEGSPEFKMLRQIYVTRILDGTLNPGQRIAKASPEIQRMMFPGATYDQIHTLAENMEFLMERRGMGRTTAGSMSAMSKVENPLVSIKGLKTIAKFVPGANPAARAIRGKFYALVTKLATSPAFMRYVEKGLNGTPEQRAAVKVLTDKVLQKGSAVGAGTAESTFQGGSP